MHRAPLRNLEPTDEHGLIWNARTVIRPDTPVHIPGRLPAVPRRQAPPALARRPDRKVRREIAVSVIGLVGSKTPRTGLVETCDDIDGVVADDPAEVLLCEMVPRGGVARRLLKERPRVADVVAFGAFGENERSSVVRRHVEHVTCDARLADAIQNVRLVPTG